MRRSRGSTPPPSTSGCCWPAERGRRRAGGGARGIYGRRLMLDFVALPEPPAERGAKLREFLAGQTVFALIGTDLSGAEGELADAAEAAGVPLLSTLAA